VIDADRQNRTRQGKGGKISGRRKGKAGRRCQLGTRGIDTAEKGEDYVVRKEVGKNCKERRLSAFAWAVQRGEKRLRGTKRKDVIHHQEKTKTT